MNVDSGRSMNKVFYIMEHIFSAISPKDQVVVLSCCRVVD